MSDSTRTKRAVCINCIDGRVQIPAINWIKDNCGVDFVDMITEPGIDGLLANNKYSAKAIFDKIRLSIDKNNSSIVCIVGHFDCKGNPVSDNEHKSQIQRSIKRLENEINSVPIMGLWVNDSWNVEKL